jgi:hypothetical protein
MAEIPNKFGIKALSSAASLLFSPGRESCGTLGGRGVELVGKAG